MSHQISGDQLIEEKKRQGGGSQIMSTFNPIEELQLQVAADDPDDIAEINMILGSILMYPSSEMAETHKEAHRLGDLDIQADIKEVKTQVGSQMAEDVTYCPCCGYIRQKDEIKLCTAIGDIKNIGISTYLYFQTLFNLGLIMLLVFIVYSIFAVATNVIASNKHGSFAQLAKSADYMIISLASKQVNDTDQNRTYYLVSCYIGVALTIFWFLAFLIIRHVEKTKEVEVETETKSASDFSIVMEGVPTDVTREEMQQYLDEYEQSITSIPAAMKRPFKMTQFNVGRPYFLNLQDFKDEEFDQINEDIQKMYDMFAEWIIERQDSKSFSLTKQAREVEYKHYDDLLKKKQAKVLQINEKLKEDAKKDKPEEETKTAVFITFEDSYAMHNMAELNPQDFGSKILYYVTCCQTQNRFKIVRKEQEIPIYVERAPEPEDIIWPNIGIPTKSIVGRKFVTYLVTVILLGISFAAVFGLTQLQESQGADSNISALISVVIALINAIIGQVIRRLTIFERDYTETHHQTSLAIKSVLAQLVNSILIPFVTYYLIKNKQLYQAKGLADNIFTLGLTTLFMPPVIKIIDPYYFFTRLMLCIKDRPVPKLYLNQSDLNTYSQLIFFEVGFEYIYIVNSYLFICFYVSLQPILPIFAVAGYAMMYWVQKYQLFNRMKRPVPGTDMIHIAMNQLIYAGPLFFCLGSLTWSNFVPDGIPKEALIPNLIALGIAIFTYLVPYRLIYACVFDEQKEPNLKYSENRILFPSEYNRLNPSTSEEGFKDYMNYIEEYKKEINGKSKEEQEAIAKKMENNGRRGTVNLRNQNVGAAGNLASLLAPQQPSVNPMHLQAALLPNVHRNHPPPMLPVPPQNMGMNQPPLQQHQQPPQQQHQQPPQQQGPPQFQQPPPQFQQPPPQFQQQRPPQFGFQQQRPPQFGFQAPQQFGFQQPQQFGFQQPQQFGFQQPQQFGFMPPPRRF